MNKKVLAQSAAMSKTSVSCQNAEVSKKISNF